MVGKCVGMWEEVQRRCRKVCGDVGEGEGNEIREEMWVSVLGPHTLIHFPHLAIPLPTHQHTSPLTPYTLPHPSQRIFPCFPPHPNTFPYTSPHTSSHSSPHLPLHPNTLPNHSPTLLPTSSPTVSIRPTVCGKVTM